MALTNNSASRVLRRGLKPHCVVGSRTAAGSSRWSSPSKCVRSLVATILARRRVITDRRTMSR
eukprot:14829973-Heterocapsa_arctica.AAC.1